MPPGPFKRDAIQLCTCERQFSTKKQEKCSEVAQTYIVVICSLEIDSH